MSKNSLIILPLLFIFLPIVVWGADIRLVTDTKDIKTNDEFLLDIRIASSEPLNAVQGKILFPADMFEVVEIRDGNSIINFWIERPHSAEVGVIVFSGITPGGFYGTNNEIFSILFKAKKAGSASLHFRDASVLKNDGLGTKAELTVEELMLSVGEGEGTNRIGKLPDMELPEEFLPIISQDPTLFEGDYFLVFATEDKGSGILRYEVHEGSREAYSVAESPYRLKNQSLHKKIFIKAIDKAGNERIVELSPKYSFRAYTGYAILVLVILYFSFIFLRRWLKNSP